MGAAFDRWLAQPSTLCFLRHMIAPRTRPARGFSQLTKAATEPLNSKHASRRHPWKEGEEEEREEEDASPPDASSESHRSSSSWRFKKSDANKNMARDAGRVVVNSNRGKTGRISKDPTGTQYLDFDDRPVATTNHEEVQRHHDVFTQDEEWSYIALSDVKSRTASMQGNQIALHMSLRTGISMLGDTESDNTFDTLKRQCDVNNEELIGKLPVDEPGQRNNFRLWIETLLFRHRIDGINGVYEVWRGMRRRDIDLPVEGPEADKLWTGFISAGICRRNQETRIHIKMRDEIVEYARDLQTREQRVYGGLYAQFVGRWLVVHQSKALKAHYMLQRWGMVPRGAVAELVPFVLRRSRAFEEFASVYRENEERDLYDSCIDQVLQHTDERTALAWHRLFLSQGDGPSSVMFARDGIQRLFELDKDASLPMKTSTKQRVAESGEITSSTKTHLPPLTRVGMNAIVGDVYGIKPKNISDSFCAKLLATTAFSTEIIINGLVFFGIQSLGPLALRELVLRADTQVEFSNLLGKLKSYGIHPDTSTFSRLVTQVPAIDSGSGLWKALAENDQHPEEYGDVALQEQLLSSYLDKRQFQKAHLTLIALSIAGTTHHNRGWNRIFQYYLAQRQYRNMLAVMQSIRDHRIPLTATTTSQLYRLLLPRRERGKNYIKGSSTNLFDSLRFCTNAFVYATEQGGYVPPYVWREILKRVGMDGRWDELKRIILWMSHWYMESSDAPTRRLVPESRTSPWKRRYPQGDMIEQVFDSKMVKAIFAWGFRYASTRRLLYPGAMEPKSGKGDAHVECWASGLALLKTVRERGFAIQAGDVLSAFVTRMWILFGPAWSKRAVNNDARRFNQMSLAEYVRHFDSIWPGLLGHVDPDLLSESSRSDAAKLLVQLFGRARATNNRADEYADVGAWARALAEYGQDFIHESSRPSVRHRAWERSPFRMRLVRPEATETVSDGQQTQTSHSSDSSNHRHEDARSSISSSHEETPQSADRVDKRNKPPQHYRPF